MAGALALCSVGFTSCDDDEEYDFPGDSSNRVYTPDKSQAFKIIQTPAGAIAAVECKIPAKCRTYASGDIKVKVEIDNSLIETYNAENGTSFLELPSEAVVIETPVMTIPAGAMASADTTRISLTDDADILAGLTAAEGYLLPVRMTEVTGGDASAATSQKSISYLTLTVTYDAVNHDATLEDATGTPVADQSGWSLSGNVDCSEGYLLFDGDATEYASFESESTMELIVDMGKVYSFDAIESKYAFAWGSWSYEYGSLSDGTDIAISTDGNTYQTMATIEGTGYNGASYVVFYGTLSARYIKLTIPATESYWGTYASFECGYFNVYAK